MRLFVRSWRFPCLLCPFLTLLSCSYSSRETRKLYQQALQKKPYDVIIVPGVPFENGQWSRVMKGRIYWSKFLYDHGIARNIIYSGSAVYTPYTEGEIMALYAISLGIPKEHIYSETRAQHSTENVYYAYRLARKMGFKTVALASDPFQTHMLRKFTRKKVSAGIGLIPMVEDSLKAMEPEMKDPVIDPQSAYRKDFISITKRENFWQRWRGTLGRNIKSTAYHK
ncbi:MAG: YdcF family protein [Bacteroidota bacterium]|nr:YdcF family protein [Bacteroidota bacterium]